MVGALLNRWKVIKKSKKSDTHTQGSTYRVAHTVGAVHRVVRFVGVYDLMCIEMRE